MIVKNIFTNYKDLNISHLCLVLACLFGVFAFKLLDPPNNNLLKKQEHLAMRAIGDDLLSNAHDHHTPVPPIQQVDSVTLRLKFDKPITIEPGELLKISLKHITPDIALGAIVHVLGAGSEEIVYGFEIDHLGQKEIACLGRTLPQSYYWIDVSFYNQQKISYRGNVNALGFASISIVLFTFFGITISKRKILGPKNNSLIEKNGFVLNQQLNQIFFDEKIIQLTDREVQILSILLIHEGELVTREYLINEVWLKKGIVTGRSLDMYISRLRKKIEKTPKVKILNQHGKGYIFKTG